SFDQVYTFLPIRKDYSVSFNRRSYDYTVLHQRSYQTEIHVLRLVFGKVCRKLGEPGLRPEMIEVTNEKVVVAKEKLKLSHVHNVFHGSLLRGYKYHPLHVISYPLDQIRVDLSYIEEPEAILDRQDRVIRNKTIPFIKILWRNHPEREATWETEESIRTSYPHFIS
nr:hypothetical protein [Tanacetum cinerariifolium]